MKNLKKMAFAFAIIATVGTVTAPVASASAAVKKSCTQTQNTCKLPASKLCNLPKSSKSCTLTNSSNLFKNCRSVKSNTLSSCFTNVTVNCK